MKLAGSEKRDDQSMKGITLMLSSLYFQWELSDDSAPCCLMLEWTHLLRELKGMFRVRELIQKHELRTLENSEVVPGCNGEE